MTTQTLTLTDFLLARLADAEWHYSWSPSDYGYGHDFRMAEVEAKKRIVEELVRVSQKVETATSLAAPPLIAREYGLEFAVKALAATYADHPDWREEWRA